MEIEYDRRGLRESVTETRANTIVSARTFTYADHWQLEEEEWTDGILHGFTLQREYLDSLKRLTDIRLKQGSDTIVTQRIDYKSGSPHIESISDLTVPATPVRAEFSIEPNSRMIAKTEFYHAQTLRLEVERQRDALDRLGYIGSATASFTYDYNAANQRSRVTTEDDHYWAWNYDDLGQLETAKRHRPNGQTVLGHDFAFTHDTIGNRTQAVRNGTASSYTPNLLNQYEEREVPGIVHILGLADPEATVTVEQKPTLRQEALFYTEFPVDNDPDAVHETIRIRGVKIEDGVPPENHVSDVDRDVFVAGTPEAFTYDDDGNLTQDGRWDYTWNAENRLVRLQTRTGLPPTLVRQQLVFNNDSDGRRIRQKISQWDDVSSDFVPVSATRYLYNHWNLLAEIDETGALLRSYLWGPSEHGQMELTATPGALLGLRDHTDNDAFYFAQADGNGNIALLIASADGTEAARYEYGPFGEPLRATGPMAQANPLRFSSKLVDAETGLYYYGYRYYSPGMGRFLNRDPIEERGGLNLYGFVGNDPVNKWDLLGLTILTFSYLTEIEDPTVEVLNYIFNGGLKTLHTIAVDVEECEIVHEHKYVGETIRYNSSGAEIDRGRSSGDTLKASTQKRSRWFRSCVCRITMEGNEKNPLLPAYRTPGITYNVRIDVTPAAREYKWRVSHDRFPSHRFYGHSGLLHDFSHVTAGSGPAALGTPFKERASGNESY